ncbi:MAG: exonuclease SbcCD subunit D [Anaerolineales bacterium]|jgi:exonuclease SbcD
MSDPIRVLHFADVHIGMENYGRIDPETGTSSRVRDFLDRMDEMIEYVLARDVDLVVFAGDAFKHRDPEPTQQREFAQRIKRLADAAPTLLVVGNHDMPGMAVKANSLDIFRALDVPGVIVGWKDDGRVVQTKRGPVYLAWMPYPMRQRLMSWKRFEGSSLQELNLGLREAVGERLRDLASEAAEHDMPRLLAGHLTVDTAQYGSERSVMLGRDMQVLLSTLADDAWDYVALGHIHKHQSLNGDHDPPVVYSGSLERIDFGEEGQTKGFCWVELERGKTRWEFVPVQARPFITIAIDVRQRDDPTQAVLEAVEGVDIEGAVLRLQVRMNLEQSAALRERDLDKTLAAATSYSLSRDIDDEVRARLGDLSPEALTPLELLEMYLKSREVEPDRIKRLVEKATALLE